MGPAQPDEDRGDVTAPADDGSGGRRREVVVPLALYKVVVVFSTLLAVLGVVAGFVTLDAATRRASAPASSIDPVLALLGLVFIASGGLVYVFAARFRAAGMGTDKTGGGERGDDG